MSRSTQQLAQGIGWDPDPQATQYLIYMDESDSPDFVELVDTGQWAPHATILATDPNPTQYLFTDEDPDEADWLVVSYAQIDGVEYWSDPHFPAAWNDIDLDGNNPLVGPTNGRIVTAQ